MSAHYTKDIFIHEFNLQPYHSGQLDNLTFAAKDVVDVKGYVASWGNPTWRSTHEKAQVDALCAEQLLCEGAIYKGNVISTEFSRGLLGTNNFYGTPLNPAAPNRFPGGSSCGSASAVGWNLVDFALGTDTGGSVRVPASYCGLYGMRPTTGRISLAGVRYVSYSFDTIGVIANHFDILSKVVSVLLSCKIDKDADIGKIYICSDLFNSADEEVTIALSQSLKILQQHYPSNLKRVYRNMIDNNFDHPCQGWSYTFKTILQAETWNMLGNWLTENNLEYGKNTYADFSGMKSLDRTHLANVMSNRSNQFHKLNNFLYPNNLLCFPTTPSIAPILQKNMLTDYSRQRPVQCMASLGCLPQITLPFASIHGAPIGLSFMAGCGKDAFLLSVTKQLNLLLKNSL